MADDALATLTPAEALGLRSNPDQVEAWLARHGLRDVPKGFFARVATLAFDAELDLERSDAARHQSARQTHANQRRPDIDRLVYMMEDLRDRLPRRLVEVHALCVEEGLSNAAAAERLGLSVSTVRSHLAKLRGIMRRNLHVKHRPRAELFGIARDAVQ
jgi:DNA-directed RNA polymerase specialized sigma24 family protein